MRKSVILLAAVGTALAASIASADVVAQIRVTAHNADNGAYIGENVWTLPSSLDGGTAWGSASGTYSNPVLLGTDTDPDPDVDTRVRIDGIAFSWLHDPQVTSSFNVAAGVTNATFTIDSSFLSFGTINPAIGFATAAIGLTDSATFGDVGSMTFTGLQPGGNSFAARFNSNASTFANLIPGGSFSVPAGGSQALTGSTPSFPGYDALPGGFANDMQSQFRFTISRRDRVVGTSTYEIIPAPSALALLGLGGLMVGRRRRA